MTISSQVKTFSGPYSGGDGTYPIGFPAENYSQLNVWRYNDITMERQQLSVENGDFTAFFHPEFGQISIESGYDTPGDYFVIASVFPEEQGTAFSSFGRFSPEIHEKAMDKIVLLLKQLRRDLDRVFTPSDDPLGPVAINADTIDIAGMDWLDYLRQAQAEARASADEARASADDAAYSLDEFREAYLGKFSDPTDFPVSPRTGAILFYNGGDFGPIGLYSFFGPGYVDSETGTPWVLSARQGDRGPQGARGERGSDGNIFEWRGTGTEPPANPKVFNFYRNILDRKVYLYTEAEVWEVIASDGAKGDRGDKGEQGDSLRWRGTFAGSRPNDPKELDLYRDSLAKKTFFYDGTDWVLWVSDGDKGDKGDRGDTMQIDAVGTFAERSFYNSEAAGFSFFAFDYEIQPSNAPREDVFTANASNAYPLSFTPKGEQSLIVSVNNIIQSSRAYSFTVSGGDYSLSLVADAGAEIVVREMDFATGTGALFIKRAGTGNWSAPIPFGQGPQGIQGPPGKDGTDGDTGPIGKTLIWKGELLDPPVDPEDFWAYRDLANKTLWFYSDGQWWEWAKDGDRGRDGVDGLNAVQLTWLGSLSSAPADPALFSIYRNTSMSRKPLLFWDGSSWNTWAEDGANGSNGSNGTNARPYLWRGALAAAPTTPAAGRVTLDMDVYRHTGPAESGRTAGNVYCHLSGSWQLWGEKGEKGDKGNPGASAPEPPVNTGSVPKFYARERPADGGAAKWTDISDLKASQTQFGMAKIWVQNGTLYISTQ